MDKGRIFGAIAEERRELADLLETLSEEQWDAPSLCGAWTVRDVAAHLVVPLIRPLRESVAAFAGAKGNLDKMNISIAAYVARSHGEHLADLLREHAGSRFAPPFVGPRAPLTDIIVHGQDIRRPLGLRRTFDPERQLAVLECLMWPAVARGIFHRRVKARWETTDLDWSSGEGPVIRGPAEAVMLALTGRLAAVAELSGDGVDLLPR